MSVVSSPIPAEQAALDALLAEVRACTICAKHLPLGPRPIVRGQASARLLIVSQAPGTRVHMTGLSFNDRSGDRLRDLPPRPECAPRWHGPILERLPKVELTLLVGSYAIDYYLGEAARGTMTETVQAWREHLPRYFALPHPSWRNTAWLRRHPWFERELLPQLRRRVRALV
jgi:uracil-DNA glycosylase